MRKNPTGWINAAIIIIIIGFGVALAKGYRDINYVNYLSLPDTTTLYKPIIKDPSNEKQSIQIGTIDFTHEVPTTVPNTPLPTTPTNPNPPQPTSPPSCTDCCSSHAPVEANNQCSCPGMENKVLFCSGSSCACDPNIMTNDCPAGETSRPAGMSCTFYVKDKYSGWKARVNNPDCQIYCWAKPVLYLYPLTPAYIDVKLDIPGKVVVSDPPYPEETGWQDVYAFPSGVLQYNNTTYHYLFYETEVTKPSKPTTGIFIPKEKIESELSRILTHFGLNTFEKGEFLEYWIPELQKLDTPYIFFSVLNDKEKQEVDKVDITPSPDTFIHFLAYFKPVNAPYSITPLNIPSTIPKRVGFTVVEWGGTIDQGNGKMIVQ